MTLPVNNANFTSSAVRDATSAKTRQPGAATVQADDSAPDAHQDTRMTLSGGRPEPVEANPLRSHDAARAVLDKVKQLIANDPLAALRSQGGLNPNAAVATLGTAA